VGGKVQVNGERVKRARAVAPGEVISIRQGAFEQVVRVRALSARRGPASDAATLYEETVESRAAREKRSLELKSMPTVHVDRGRPTKRDRREMGKWRDKW
jgi:ribosome-associated heat shock protein Hsp15